MAKAQKKQAAAPWRPDVTRIDLAMQAAGQIQVLSRQVVRHAVEDLRNTDSSESEAILVALAGRCASLGGAVYTLLVEDVNLKEKDLQDIESMVRDG